MKAFNSMRAHAMAGFTLVELMTSVLVLAILASIAIPTYSNQIRKSRRSEAKSALLDLAGREERYMATNGVYTSTPAALGYGTFTNIGSGYYTLAVSVNPATAPNATSTGSAATYTLTATVTTTNGQNKDTSCQTFMLNSQGQQLSYSSANVSGWVTANLTTGCW